MKISKEWLKFEKSRLINNDWQQRLAEYNWKRSDKLENLFRRVAILEDRVNKLEAKGVSQ